MSLVLSRDSEVVCRADPRRRGIKENEGEIRLAPLCVGGRGVTSSRPRQAQAVLTHRSGTYIVTWGLGGPVPLSLWVVDNLIDRSDVISKRRQLLFLKELEMEQKGLK